jgi:uncharacterized protein YkwD
VITSGSFGLEYPEIRHTIYRVNVSSWFLKASLAACLCMAWIPMALAEAPVDEAPEGPTPAQLKRVAGFIQSTQASQRAAAYKACRARGEDFKDDYFKILLEAQDHHAKHLQNLMLAQTHATTPLGQAITQWEAWKSLAEPALESVLTDHRKDQSRMDEMDRLFVKVAKEWERVLALHKRLSKSGGDASLGIEAGLAALREIHKEKAWCRPDDFFEDEETDIAFFDEELSLQGGVTEKLEVAAAMTAAIRRRADTHAANDSEKWASPAQKEFARILNDRRVALGLQPLRLEQKLSDACIGHSKEMTALSYFSHTSPVEENRTFGMRAQKAGFTGAARGECIFSGDASPVAAERAWWYSDGHRLINYSRGPNTLGIGPAGTMWTLNVGSMDF